MSAAGPRVLLVTARFYADIAAELEAGARDALAEADARVDAITVPGAFEIPGAISARHRARAGYDGYVALGCVIRGETSHYDYVCGECARGLMTLTLDPGLAIGFGVLTVENEAQAWARASRAEKNKGAEAARACLSMIALCRATADQTS